MTYIVQRKDRFDVVAYERIGPLTGRERRRWHPVGHDRADAEKIAARLGAERVAPVVPKGGAITVGESLTHTWMPQKRRHVRATTASRYAWFIERYISPAILSLFFFPLALIMAYMVQETGPVRQDMNPPPHTAVDPHPQTRIRRVWNFIRFPPSYEGPILSGRMDGATYLLGWAATFAHITLWVVVLVLGLHQPRETISTFASVIATLFLLTIVIVIHRRMGHGGKLPRSIVWQLGSSVLFLPGLILLTLGVTLRAGATGAVKAIKMSAKLMIERPAPADAASPA